MVATPANAINESTTGIVGFTSTAFVGSPATQYTVQVGGSTTSTLQSVGPGSVGQVLRSGGAGANPAYSTATYPSTAGTSGNVLTSNGTDWVSSAAPGGGLIRASGVLTSAQIKALHATPIQIIAAPGVGKVIQLQFLLLTMNYGGSNVFVAGAAQTIDYYYSTNVASGANGLTNGQITNTQSQYFSNRANISNQDLANVANLAINLYNPVATEISGNAANDNTVSYSVTYEIITP